MLSKNEVLLFMGIVFFSSCVKNNEEELYSDCETGNVTYSVHIKPYINNSCLSCHNSIIQSGNIDYSSFEGVKKSVQEGSFLGSIQHSKSFSAMPPSVSKTDDCKMNQIQAWINKGAKQN